MSWVLLAPTFCICNTSVGLKNFGGLQITQNTNFFIMLLKQELELNLPDMFKLKPKL